MDPSVSELRSTLNAPTHMAMVCSGFFILKFLPNRGPNINERAGLASCGTSVQAQFISRARNPPPTPMVGVIPNPYVLVLNSTKLLADVTSLGVLVESGTHIPNPTSVDA